MPEVRRAALLSLHTSPLEQPGGGDAGGMNVYVRSLAEALAETGTDVEIFTRAAAELPELEQLRPGVLVRHVRAGPPQRLPKEELPAHVNSLALAMNQIRQLLAEGHFDVLHSHYWVSGLAGLLMTDRWEIPLVHSMHTMARVKNRYLGPGDRPEPPARVEGERRIVRQAGRLIANTAVEADELRDLYDADPARIDIVPPGVDLTTFRPGDQQDARRQLGVPEGTFQVLFAGRIQRLKGPQVLIDALAELSGRRPDIPVRANIFGAASGTDSLQLQPLIEARGLTGAVQLCEPVDAGRLAQWYRAADVVVMPSFSESFGLVALEAQACGTPVLATDVGGLSRAVRDGGTGMLIEGHDPRTWAGGLAQLYDNAELRHRMGRAAAHHARGFGWARTAALTLQSYERAIRTPH